MPFREIIQVFVGQAGCQIGDACWELYALEHNVDPNGDFVHPVKNDHELFELSTFFSETPAKKAAPRTLLIDSEPSVLDEIRMGCYRNFFASVNLISGAEDAASNFGRGYFHLSANLLQPCTNSLRKLAEQCEGLQGILFHRAYGGGTGTGFACSLLSATTEEYFKTPCIDLGILPSLTMACGPVEPYNALLSCEMPIEDVSLAMMMDNKALMNVCGKKLATYRPTFTNFNRIIAQTMSGLTASFRFTGLSNMNICDLRTNLVPYPEAHFALSSFAPFCLQESLDRWAPTTGHLTNEVFSPANQLISHKGEQPIYLSCCMFYRGKASVREVNSTLERMRRSGDLPLVDWCPTGFKVGISAQPMSIVPASRIGQAGTSVVALHNSTLFRDPLHNLVHAFNMLMQRRAFLHWFLAEGLEEDEFRQALEGIRKLEEDYTEFARASQDKVLDDDVQEESRKKKKATEMELINEMEHREPVPPPTTYLRNQKRMTEMELINEKENHGTAPIRSADSTYVLENDAHERHRKKNKATDRELINEMEDRSAVPVRSADSTYFLDNDADGQSRRRTESRSVVPVRPTDSTYDRGNPQVSITLRVSHAAQQDMSSNRHRSTESTLRRSSSAKRRASGDETGSTEYQSQKTPHAAVSRDKPSKEDRSTTQPTRSSRHHDGSSAESRKTMRRAKDREVGEQKPEVIDLGGRELRYNETMEDLAQYSFQEDQLDESYTERNNLHTEYEPKRFARQNSSEICDTENQTTGVYSQPGRSHIAAVRPDCAVIDRMNSASPALRKRYHSAAVDICQICLAEGCTYCDVEYDDYHDEEKNDDSRFCTHHRRSHGRQSRKSLSRKTHRPPETPLSLGPDPKAEHAEIMEEPLRAVLTGLHQLREVVTCLKRRL